jgi:hypothetical protein
VTTRAEFGERRLMLVTRILRKREARQSVADDEAALRALVKDQLRAEVKARKRKVKA